MKKILFILSLVIFVGVLAIPNTSFAQLKPQCSDGQDNDGDGGIDVNGWKGPNPATGMPIQIKKDDQCLTPNTVCENGSTTCLNSTSTTGGTDINNPSTTGGSTVQPTTDFPLQVKLKNPLKVNTIEEAIKVFMDAVVKIAIPFIVVFFIWSGINFILARGNPEKIKAAKNMFWYTVIGTLLILGAWAITDAIVGTINSIAS